MSISSRITAIEEHLGVAYNKLSDLGANLTNTDKNINNVGSVLDAIYEDYPKTTTKGVWFSLTDIKESRIQLIPYGNISQEGNPSPNNNIPVKIVNGEYTIKVEKTYGARNQVVVIDTSSNPLYSENDYYYKSGTDWYVHNEWTKVKLSSQQTWNTQSIASSGVRYYTDDFGGTFKPASATFEIGNVKSNYYTAQSVDSSWTGNEGISLSLSNAIYVNDSNYQDDLNGWLEWLDSVNCYVYLELANPTNTKILNQNLIDALEQMQNLKSYQDSTYISQEHSVYETHMTIEVRALPKASAITDALNDNY